MPPWDGKPEFNTADQEFDAAQALFELLGGVSASIPAAPPAANSLHWKGKKIRSNRGAKSVCACKSPTSITVSSSRIPPLLLDLYSSSATAVEEAVQEVIDIVKQEEECLETEARSGTSAVDVERQQTKLLSESSLESMQQLNSRAESPSSPLPPAPRAHADFLLPKSESAFKQVEVDKIAEPPNKLAKVEQKEATQSNPRISQTWHQVVPAKAVAGEFPNQPGGLLCELSNGRIEGHGRHLMLSPTRGLTTVDNVEIRQREKLSPSVQGRKPSSEVEKEAHRVRRIQANRESARQAIQRKQVLCEELGRKAAELLAEKEDLRQKVDQQSAEYRLLLEMNMRLKEQVVLQADNKLKQPSCRLSSSTVPPMPSAPQFTGPLLPPFWWAFALAQATASKMSAEQAVSRTLASQNYPMLSIATTAFNNGNRFPDVWMGQDGSITTSMSALVHTGATTIQHFSSTTLDTQQPTSSVALPAIYTAHTKVLPDESPIVSIDREGDRNFERNTCYESKPAVGIRSGSCSEV